MTRGCVTRGCVTRARVLPAYEYQMCCLATESHACSHACILSSINFVGTWSSFMIFPFLGNTSEPSASQDANGTEACELPGIHLLGTWSTSQAGSTAVLTVATLLIRIAAIFETGHQPTRVNSIPCYSNNQNHCFSQNSLANTHLKSNFASKTVCDSKSPSWFWLLFYLNAFFLSFVHHHAVVILRSSSCSHRTHTLHENCIHKESTTHHKREFLRSIVTRIEGMQDHLDLVKAGRRAIDHDLKHAIKIMRRISDQISTLLSHHFIIVINMQQ